MTDQTENQTAILCNTSTATNINVKNWLMDDTWSRELRTSWNIYWANSYSYMIPMH